MEKEFFDRIYKIYKPELKEILINDTLKDYNHLLNENKSNFIPKKGNETLPSKTKRNQLRKKRK